MIRITIKNRLFILFFALLFFTQTTIMLNNNATLFTNNDNNNFINSRNKVSSYTISDPISITSDSDFSTQAINNGWAGNGSASNPYIIENLQIVNATNNTNGISMATE